MNIVIKKSKTRENNVTKRVTYADVLKKGSNYMVSIKSADTSSSYCLSVRTSRVLSLLGSLDYQLFSRVFVFTKQTLLERTTEFLK